VGCLQPPELLVRYTAGTFAAILPAIDIHGACTIAERMRAHTEALAIPHATTRSAQVVTLSAGAACTAPSANEGPDVLVRVAEAALFRAKRDGRNRCRAHGFDAGAIARRDVEAPRVYADRGIASYLTRFLESRRIDLRDARVAAHRGDAGRVRLIARNLAELARSMHLGDLADHARCIEAATADLRGLLATIDRAALYLERVEVVSDRTLQYAS
jgi:hypothetical protein